MFYRLRPTHEAKSHTNIYFEKKEKGENNAKKVTTERLEPASPGSKYQ